MYRRPEVFIASAVLVLSPLAVETKARADTAKAKDTTNNVAAVLWREPADIASRNLFYGPAERPTFLGDLHVQRGRYGRHQPKI
jgi:hypothetical protein